ncbi:PREDICTED: RNA-binding protein 39-like [Sturnus vulgaris]|uniref:RNA-binding protein 39-like n=1 Tax=Sturnus vulgaris TaxID=9172 RepID=UPI00071A768B|nr:PREDICTED: RNA-binding protein 39-like [Sturnus vulgaris]
MQLAARIRPRDLEDFFSAVGKVRDVRIISDRNSRRSKGIAYVEFCEIQSVPLAIGLTGQRLLGVPIIVQASQDLFEPFSDRPGPSRRSEISPVLTCAHLRSPVQFSEAECARRALTQLNGFELAGRPMRLAPVSPPPALSPALNLASQCLTLSGLFSPQTM